MDELNLFWLSVPGIKEAEGNILFQHFTDLINIHDYFLRMVVAFIAVVGIWGDVDQKSSFLNRTNYCSCRIGNTDSIHKVCKIMVYTEFFIELDFFLGEGNYRNMVLWWSLYSFKFKEGTLNIHCVLQNRKRHVLSWITCHLFLFLKDEGLVSKLDYNYAYKISGHLCFCFYAFKPSPCVLCSLKFHILYIIFWCDII